MGLQLVTAPAVEPLSTDEAKLHLEVQNSDRDGYIDSLVKSAREYCEQYTGRALINQTWRLYIDEFPSEIRLPMPPFSSLTHLRYVNTSGTLTTMVADTDYTVSAYLEPARVVPAYGTDWPTARSAVDVVQATYVAGYGATAASVPEPIRQACRLLIGHWFENRETIVVGTISATLDFTVKALLEPYRVWEYR